LQLRLIEIQRERLRRQAAESELAAERDRLLGESIYDFIPRVTHQRHAPPTHLDPLVELFELAWSQSVWATAHAPPRHAKTETCLAFLAQTLVKFPRKRVAYVTYEATLAEEKSLKAKELAAEAGLAFGGKQTARLWQTAAGGSFRATGIGGPLTGSGVDILVVDDPYKNYQQAESGAWRRMVNDWWEAVAGTRIEPGGSAFVFHTRWTAQDLTGYVHKRDGLYARGGMWRDVILPAIADVDVPADPRRPFSRARSQGEALWPERWSVANFDRARRNAFVWAALFQGAPRPRDGALFGEPSFYRGLLPQCATRAVVGLDFNYTASTKNDYSAAVALVGEPGRQYVAMAKRRQCRAPDFVATILEFKAAFPYARFVAYAANGPEKGVVDLVNALLAPHGVFVEHMPATTDKYQRAQATAARWNAGEIVVPQGGDPDCPACALRNTVAGAGACSEHAAPEWIDDLLAEVCAFTGKNDPHDDFVDALAGASDAIGAFTDPVDIDSFVVGGQRGRGRRSR
jgi:hypothetical protein